MPIKIADNNGMMRDASSRIHSGYWRNVVAWVYANGEWRRTYDPTDENLITNSRLLNGTDYFTYADGTIIGSTPPGWSMYSNTPAGQGNAYAYYSPNPDEFSRRYTFKTMGSRLFMQGRLSVRQGEVYNASAIVHSVAVGNQRKIVDIYVESESQASQPNYIQILTPFPSTPNIQPGQRIQCVFRALRDCVVQFNMGVGVDYNDNGEVSIDSPMISKTSVMLDYQPTPKKAVYNAIFANNSWFEFDEIMSNNGTQKISSSIAINSISSTNKLIIVGRTIGTLTSGIGIDLNTNTLFIMVDNQINKQSSLSKPIPRDSVIGLNLWFNISGSFVSDVVFQLNGETIGEIHDYSSLIGSFTTVYGSPHFPANEMMIEQFSVYSDRTNYCFNLEEGSGNIVHSTCMGKTATIHGVEGTDFYWMGAKSPTIILNPLPIYEATTDDIVVINTDASEYDSVQWRTSQDGDIVGAVDRSLSITITEDYEYGTEYYAVYKNKFGETSTTIGKIVSSTDSLVRITSEDDFEIIDEDGMELVEEIDSIVFTSEDRSELVDETTINTVVDEVSA